MRFDEYDAHDGTGLAALVRKGEVSADELLDLALARSADTDDAIAAVVHLQEPVARAAITQGLPDGAFRGVPFLLKDLGCEAIDFPTAMGSRLYEGYRYTYDSEMFVRMQRTGLVTFGRTTSPEFGVGPTTEAAVYGRPTRNPWHRDHVAGGSSGGSGASVAAGVVPMAHGSDGGGSVRIPASSCGLFGLKPTRAMLPDGPASGEGWAGMAIDGFLTRSVRDTAAMLDATVGPDLGAPYFAPPQPGSFVDAIATPPRRLRIAVAYGTFDGAPIHPDCVDAVRHTAGLLDSLGHEVVEHQGTVLPTAEVEAFITAWSQIVACGSQLTVRQRAAALGHPVSHPEVQSRIERVTRLACDYATSVSGSDYLAAIDVVHALGRRMARFLEPYDMLLTTTLGEPPAHIGRFSTERVDAWNSFLDYRLHHVLPYSPITVLANGTGQPAMSLPLWWNDDGLPVGSHLMGRTGDDQMLLRLAA
ncbi:MAG: amidase, partial [Actinomycetota bacterium]